MKKLLLSIASAAMAATLLASCSEESDNNENVEPQELTSQTISWTVNGVKLVGTSLGVEAGEYLTFSDLSQGATSHEWLVTTGENTGVYFLKGDFANSTETDAESKYDAYINSELTYSCTETDISLYFKTIGSNTIVLRNTYATEVTANYEDTSTGERFEIYSTLNDNGEYVLEIPIYITINNNATIAWSVSSDDAFTKNSSTDYSTTVGSALTFTDNSLWNTDHEWFISDDVELTSGTLDDDSITVSFPTSGSHTITLHNIYISSVTSMLDGAAYSTSRNTSTWHYYFRQDITVDVSL